ncbi:unnamed protein product, partial [Prorocentrum cordatum]
IVQKSLVKGRPFVGATKEVRIAHRLRAHGALTMVGGDERSVLDGNAVAPETLAYYRDTLDGFQMFVGPFELPLPPAAQVVLVLMNYADYAWSIGLERVAVLNTYAEYISAHPDFSRKKSLRLPRLYRALQGSKRLVPGRSRPTMPWQVVALVALVMAMQRGSQHAALRVVTTFGVHLNPSEAVGLREQDLFLPLGLCTVYGFNLHPIAMGEYSKTSLSDEGLLLSSVEVPGVGPRLARARSGGPQATLFRLTAAQLVVQWRQSLERVEVPYRYLPYQLRYAQATSYVPPRDVPTMDSQAVHAAGWASEGWDYADDPRADLLEESFVDSLVLRISRKEVAGVHVGLDCKTWSRARKNDGRGPPPLRDDAHLHGLPLLAAADAEKVMIANRLLANVLRLLAAAIEAGIPFSLENPRSSRLWLVPELLDMARDAHAEWASVDYCQYQ